VLVFRGGVRLFRRSTHTAAGRLGAALTFVPFFPRGTFSTTAKAAWRDIDLFSIVEAGGGVVVLRVSGVYIPRGKKREFGVEGV